MIKRQTKDFLIQQGDDVKVTFDIIDDSGAPVDLSTGYLANMQARISPSDAVPVFSLSKDNGLVLQNRIIEATFTHEMTAAFRFDKAEYDLEVVTDPGNLVTTVYSGVITLRKEITR